MKFYSAICAAVLSVAASGNAAASNCPADSFCFFSGTLSNLESVVFIDFTVHGPGNVTIETTSAGDGSVNVDLMLALYDPSGIFVGFGDDQVDPIIDATIEATGLGEAGNYRLAVTAFPNYPNGDLADGFTVCDICEDPAQLDRALYWEVKFSGDVASATLVPEPDTYALLAGGLGAIAWVARRRKTA